MSPFRNQRFAYFDSDPGNDGFRGDVELCDVDSDQMSNRTERGGMIVATLATTIGLFLLVLWSVNQSSFERCSALEKS